eukprot:scaffold231_cov258-Chaetoceros_neogracile.AAC.9
MKTSIVTKLIAFGVVGMTSAYTVSSSSSRKVFLETCKSTIASAAFLQVAAPLPSFAFDGSGSSAYNGKNAASKAELKKSYRTRIIADVKDFKALGTAIQNGETEGRAWGNFFIEFQRREPDEYGRAYAAQVDLVGNKDLSGCGTLLAGSYAKPGKPADGLPSIKAYNTVAKTFDPIKAAGKKGDAAKSNIAWLKASELLSAYLETVELPSSLSDPLYD